MLDGICHDLGHELHVRHGPRAEPVRRGARREDRRRPGRLDDLDDGALPLGILLFVLTPAVSYVLYPPTIKRGPEVVTWAAAELVAMGPISRREVTMALLAIAALAGWIFGGAIMAPVIVSLIVIALMVITGVVTWNDVIGNRQGWNVLVWFATLVAMADGLNQVGFLGWLAERSAATLAGWSAVTIAVVLIALFFVIHYLFASTTAHATAVLPAFLVAVVAVPGMPVRAVVLTMLYSVGLMGVLTPHATGPAPVWFSAGYVAPEGFLEAGRHHGRHLPGGAARSRAAVSLVHQPLNEARVGRGDPGSGTSGPELVCCVARPSGPRNSTSGPRTTPDYEEQTNEDLQHRGDPGRRDRPGGRAGGDRRSRCGGRAAASASSGSSSTGDRSTTSITGG